MRKSLYLGWLAMVTTNLACYQPPSAPSQTTPTRTVQHAMGKTQVPMAPERVVVLDYAPLDTAFALEFTPVGRPEEATSFIYPAVNDDVASIGEGYQPNIEAILDLEPDLILGTTVIGGGSYQRLSQIAPTIFSEDNGRYGNWQEVFLLHAEALGQLKKAEALLVDYQLQVDALKSKLGRVPQATTVSVASNWSGGVVAYTANSFSGSILYDLGFQRNSIQAESDNYALQPSKEELDAIDGDVLFLMYNAEFEGSIAKENFVSDPLWSTLNVVQQGVVCEVSTKNWAGGRGVLAAHQILTDIEACLD